MTGWQRADPMTRPAGGAEIRINKGNGREVRIAELKAQAAFLFGHGQPEMADVLLAEAEALK